MKSENLFTAFFYEPSDGQDCIPVDLYTGEYSSSSDALLPPIDTNISYMMLLVSMASRYPLTRSHIKEHYHEIDAIGCESLAIFEVLCYALLSLVVLQGFFLFKILW